MPKMNSVDPQAWLTDVLAPIAVHPSIRFIGWTNCCPKNWTPPTAVLSARVA
jgi:transposase